MTQSQATVIETWVLGKHFLENKWSENVTSQKTTKSICWQWKHLDSQMKLYIHLQFVKCVSASKRLTTYQYLDFPDEIGGINQDELSILWNDMYHPFRW